MSLLLNMLSRLVITFLPRSKRLLNSWLQSPSAVILEPKKIKSDTVSPSTSSSHVQMWELDQKEGWVSNNWCFWTVVLEKTHESLLDSKEVKTINPKGNQPWIFIGSTDAEAEVSTVWPPDAKSSIIGKAPDSGKDSGQEENGGTEDEMVRWHPFNGHEFGQTQGDNEGQGGLVCCSPWNRKKLDTTQWLNNNNNIYCYLTLKTIHSVKCAADYRNCLV